MSERAWLVSDRAEPELCDCVFAATRGQARKRGAQALDTEFCQVRAIRHPVFDGYAEHGWVPMVAWYDAGHPVECDRCGVHTADGDGGKVVGEKVYCGECADPPDKAVIGDA